MARTRKYASSDSQSAFMRNVKVKFLHGIWDQLFNVARRGDHESKQCKWPGAHRATLGASNWTKVNKPARCLGY